MLALSRGPQAGQLLMTVAISEALSGLHDQAKARIAAAENDGLLGDASVDERMVVAAITEDGPAARALLPIALEEIKKSAGSEPQAAENARAVQALVALAERRPKDAIALLEPVTFDTGHSDVVNMWAISKRLAGDLPAAAKGLAFINSKDARSNLTTTSAYAYATLARVQAQLGQTDEARRTYQKFFEIWKDADPDLPLLIQAREEFVRLR
jgi:tetratricopeptide (TPR) repeat protein